MASSHVLYHCPCDQASASATASTSRSSSSLASPPPGLPAHSPASRYSFHPLDSLYFCDECDKIRCNRCVTVDISSYYCPNCLFEVPGASVKAEKNRCARNCFECPCCQHTLSVLASDLNSETARSIDPADPAASQGEPPYYLGCSFCRWDSKSVGLVFEKPTGLSLQLQRSEDNAADVLEFDRLKDHFDPYLKAQTQAAILSAAIGSFGSSTARKRPISTASAASASSSNSATSNRSARVTAARNAAAAALQSSKLLRDLPHLAHSKHLGASALNNSARSAPIEPDELKRYRALNPWQPSADGRSASSSQSSSSMGVVAKREKHRRDYVARLQSTPGQPFASLDDKISTLQQRWSAISIADQPVRAAELRPTRVPLKSKLSKRCPACRHIVVKPDIKAASNRFKIKLIALNFLPEIQISLAPQQPYLDPLRFRLIGATGSGLTGAGTATSTLRRRPPPTLVSGTDSFGTASSLKVTSQDVDVNRLVAGETYSFQISVANPLDDAIQVDISFVRFALPSHLDTSAEGGDPTVHPFPQPKHIFAAQTGDQDATPASNQISSGEQSAQPSERRRLGWQVYPSTTSIPLNAFNEVWDLEEAEDLYDSRTEVDITRPESTDAAQRRPAVKTATVRRSETAGSREEATWVIEDEEGGEDDEDVSDEENAFSDIGEEEEADGDKESNTTRRNERTARRREQRQKPRSQLFSSSSSSTQRKRFVQKGHTTTFYLDLAISTRDPPRAGPLELAMHVTYTYTANGTQQGEQASTARGKDFSFWTSVRLGTVVASEGLH